MRAAAPRDADNTNGAVRASQPRRPPSRSPRTPHTRARTFSPLVRRASRKRPLERRGRTDMLLVRREPQMWSRSVFFMYNHDPVAAGYRRVSNAAPQHASVCGLCTASSTLPAARNLTRGVRPRPQADGAARRCRLAILARRQRLPERRRARYSHRLSNASLGAQPSCGEHREQRL